MKHRVFALSILLLISFNRSESMAICEPVNLAPLLMLSVGVPGVLGICYFAHNCTRGQFLASEPEMQELLENQDNRDHNGNRCVKTLTKIGLCGLGWLGIASTVLLTLSCG